MDIVNQIQSATERQKEVFKEKEKKLKKELEKEELEAKKKKEQESEEEKKVTSTQPDTGLDEEAARAQRELQEQQVDALHSNATKADFEDRNEYIYKDGTKVVDHGDSFSVQGGRWSTAQDEATLIVETAQAKGWDTISMKGEFTEEQESYIKAIAKANGLEAKTEAEWEAQWEAEAAAEAASESDLSLEGEDELDAPEIDEEIEIEELPPLIFDQPEEATKEQPQKDQEMEM